MKTGNGRKQMCGRYINKRKPHARQAKKMCFTDTHICNRAERRGAALLELSNNKDATPKRNALKRTFQHEPSLLI